MSAIAVPDIAAAEALPDGSWVQDADGDFACLIDTHMGFPQRMAMPKGGSMLVSLEHLKFPLYECEIVLDVPCPHAWGTIGEGHCRRCGALIAWSPVYFNAEQSAVFSAVAEQNAKAEHKSKFKARDRVTLTYCDTDPRNPASVVAIVVEGGNDDALVATSSGIHSIAIYRRAGWYVTKIERDSEPRDSERER